MPAITVYIIPQTAEIVAILLSFRTIKLNRIIAKMEQCDEYVTGETPVIFVGLLSENKNFQKKIPLKYGISTEKSFTSSVTYASTYISFIQIVMNNNINLNVWTQEYNDFPKIHAAEISDMSAFPAKNCCKMIDGKMVVKLSDDALEQYAKMLDYKIITSTKARFCIDKENFSDKGTKICGRAYHENDVCRVGIVANGQFFETTVVKRPDVQKAFGLNNDKHGFVLETSQIIDEYKLYLVNDNAKEIYIIKSK